MLILLTDGANTAGEIDPLKAAELAQQIGLRIYTIGIGAEQMVVSSITGGMRRVNPSADLDEATLTQIAELTGGRISARRTLPACRKFTACSTKWSRSRNRRRVSGP